MKKLIPLLMLTLAGCSPDDQTVDSAANNVAIENPDSATPDESFILSPDGYGPLHFGMKIEEAETVLGARSNAERALEQSCDYTEFSALPGVRFMVENGVVTRAEAGAGIVNARNIKLGDSIDYVTAAQPDAVLTPHKYEPDAFYILFISAAGDRGIVLETSGGVVSRIRAGLEPAVEYVEGCS